MVHNPQPTQHGPTPYTLASDPWWCWNRLPTSRPAYVMGKRVGTIGACHPAALFPFPSHDAAMRHTLDPDRHPMPDLRAHTPLSPADVLDLRVSVRSRVPDLAAPASVPCVHYNAGLDGYELRQGTVVLCWSRSLPVVAALLRGERFEPGFIRRVLDPDYTPEEIGLDADAREAARRQRAATDAHTRAHARAEEEAARERRLRAPAPSDAPPDLSLDDLLGGPCAPPR